MKKTQTRNSNVIAFAGKPFEVPHAKATPFEVPHAKDVKITRPFEVPHAKDAQTPWEVPH